MGTTALQRADAPAGEGSQASGTPRAIDAACRVLDLILTTVMLVLLLPLMLVIAVAIRIDSGGPVLFRQRRVGRGQAPFTVNKFRTMHQGASHKVHQEFVLKLIAGEVPAQQEDGPRFKLASDSRVTRVGRILRKSSLDELPSSGTSFAATCRWSVRARRSRTRSRSTLRIGLVASPSSPGSPASGR